MISQDHLLIITLGAVTNFLHLHHDRTQVTPVSEGILRTGAVLGAFCTSFLAEPHTLSNHIRNIYHIP